MEDRCRIRMEGAQEMQLRRAILLYEGYQSSFATVHKVSQNNGVPVLDVGEAMSLASLASIAMSLGTSAHIGKFLRPEILSVGMNSVVWWIKPDFRRVWFNCSNNKTIGVESAETPHPGLVMAVVSDRWYVFAVKGDTRPEADTLLYQAPYFNVWTNGLICTGSTQVPEDVSASNIASWETAFFSSAFSHPNVHAPDKLLKYRGGEYKFWRHMLDGRFKDFPEKVLVASDLTVEGFIQEVCK